jgi:hypothetical protein
MAYSHEARTLLREPVNTDSPRLARGNDFADRCFGSRALNGLATCLGSGLGFAGLAGGVELSVAGLEPEPVLAKRKKMAGVGVSKETPGPW